MLKISIPILTFGSVGLIAGGILPLIVARFEQAQKKKFDKTVEKLLVLVCSMNLIEMEE